MLNQCNFIGNCGRDPEIRFTTGGAPVASVSLAVSEKWKDKSGQQQEKTEWINLVVWNRLAEVFRDYVKKGDKIFVSGKLSTRKWNDKDGNPRQSTEIIVAQMEMLGSKGSSGSRSSGGSQDSDSSSDGDFGGITDDQIPF